MRSSTQGNGLPNGLGSGSASGLGNGLASGSGSGFLNGFVRGLRRGLRSGLGGLAIASCESGTAAVKAEIKVSNSHLPLCSAAKRRDVPEADILALCNARL